MIPSFPSMINIGFLIIPDSNYQILLSHIVVLVIFLIVSFLIISAIISINYTTTGSERRFRVKLLSSIFSFLKNFLDRHKNRSTFNIRNEFISFNLICIIMSLVNISLLILFPISQQYSGIQINQNCMIVILCMFLNLIIYAGIANYHDKNTVNVIFRNSRLLLAVLMVIIVAGLSVSGSLHSFRISSIVQIQQNRFLFTLPMWNSLRSPLLFLNSILFFAYFVLLVQLLNQNELTIPFKTPVHPLKMNHTFSFRVIELWKFSFLLQVTFFYIFLFWGAYISPFHDGTSLISNFSAILWLLLKISTFLILIGFVYRSIPHLIEEQILHLTYTYIFPIQIISLVLGLLFLQT